LIPTVDLATGVIERAGAILLVACRYPNHPELLWTLPGGRRRPGELLVEALVREFREETRLAVVAHELLYISESFDRAGGVHVRNATFRVSDEGEPRVDPGDAHVVSVEWVPRRDLPARLTVAVLREPLLASLAGDTRRYFGFADAEISIEFADPA
jgi:ADP-ribose pyrophosphatase YjhB (NUDIX family)